MRQFVFLLIAVVSVCRCAYPQTGDRPAAHADLPHLPPGMTDDGKALAKDMSYRYADAREAALAAFKSGYLAAKDSRNRAIGLFLLALHRDPTFVKALFNLGVLCAERQLWQDAEAFYREVLKVAGDRDLDGQAQVEIERLQFIEKLESTEEGRKEKKFDLGLAAALREKNKNAGVDQAKGLIKLDGKRWEAPALAGVLSAQLRFYAESKQFLEQASSLAPPGRRDQLKQAAVVAQRQADFLAETKNAGELWDQQKYAQAAEEYSSAWGNNPADSSVAIRAATGFLMADQIPQAVTMLSTIRGSVPLVLDEEIVRMLKELAAVYPEAQVQAGKAVTPVENANAVEPSDHIRIAVGILASREMEILAKPSPVLAEDRGKVTPIPDPELTNNPFEFGAVSGPFAVYQQILSSAAVGTAPGQVTSQQVQPPVVSEPDKPRPRPQ
jgi:hypothetical protein